MMKTKRGANWEKTQDGKIAIWLPGTILLLAREDIKAMSAALCDKDEKEKIREEAMREIEQTFNDVFESVYVKSNN